MRMMLALLCLSAGFALAQTKPTHENAAPESYPVWWETNGVLHLTKLEDAAASFAEPFSKDDLDWLQAPPYLYHGPPMPAVHNCKELLESVDPNDYHSPKRVWAWGMIGSRCAELRELAHAVPARRSAVRNSVWTAAVFSLLPAGIYAASGDEHRRAAVEAGNKGLSLRQFWEQLEGSKDWQENWKRVPISHDFYSGQVYVSLGADDPGFTDGYGIVARGDFDGDGWEDIMIEAIWSVRGSPANRYSVYVLTRKSEDGRFKMVRQVF
jgi:hypothetical protein